MNALLPDLANPQGHDMPRGPTPWSNWVIPGRVLAGAYPASLDDVETEQLLSLLLELGVNTFVCLQAEVNIHIPEHSWRAGVGLRPYIRDAQRILSRAQASGSTRISQRKVDFLHLPIIDGSVTTDSAMSRLADDCCERVLKGETMYIHCWGGHGRTGTLVAVMLGRLYNLPASAALRLTQAYHDSRIYPQGVRSPQTTVQRAQVKRLLLLPNTFAGISKSTASSSNSSSTRSLQQQQVGSPTGSLRSLGPFSPATPAKQPVTPLNKSCSRSLSSAAARAAGSPTSAAAAAAAAVGSFNLTAASGSSSNSSTPAASAAARNVNLSQPFARTAAAMPNINSSSSSSSGYQSRLLQHSQTAPAAAAAAKLPGSFISSSSSKSSSGSSARQGWPAGSVAVSALAAAGSGSRGQTAGSSLLRSDVLRTPMQARLVQPVSHRG